MINEEQESFMTARADGLGGTDLAAIVGLSPWKRPIEIYEGKINPGGFPELDKELLFWGSALEPLIRERYAIRFDVDVTAPKDIAALFPRSKPWKDQTIVIGEEPWMLGTPDGLMPQFLCGWECKCSGRKSDEWGTPGTDQVPEQYLIQVMWYMAVTGYKAWNIAVLFAGNSLQSYRVERDDGLVKALIEAGRAFWNDHVLTQVPPPIDESEAYGRYLARKFSIGNGNLVPCTPDISEHALLLKMAQARKKEAEAAEQMEKNHLFALLGDSDGSKTELGKIGIVRSTPSVTTDYKTAFAELSAFVKGRAQDANEVIQRIIETCSKPTERSAYCRAWFAKER
jgi:putative phage-type endonuclease